jgi:Zn finger protein HypA/HybF involved in hydrogenase expression
MAVLTRCRSCDAQLSAYAKPSEKVCAPCDRRMVAISQQHAFEMEPIERDHAAFALR